MALTTKSTAFHISCSTDPPAVRIQINLLGEKDMSSYWMEFVTPEQAWTAIDGLIEYTEEAFGKRQA